MMLHTSIVLSALMVAAALKDSAAATTVATSPSPASEGPSTTTTTATNAKTTFSIAGMYADTKCASPNVVSFTSTPAASCQSMDCTSQMKLGCNDDYKSSLTAAFGSKPYASMVLYNDAKCSSVSSGNAFPIDGLCHVSASQGTKVTLNADKTVTIAMYPDDKCASKPMLNQLVSSDNNNKCINNMMLSGVNVALGAPPAPTYVATSYFTDDKCTSQPIMMVAQSTLVATDGCKSSVCSRRATTQCTQDPKAIVSSACVAPKACALTQFFNDPNCIGDPVATTVMPADGTCRNYEDQYYKVTVNADKTVTIAAYTDAKCVIATGDQQLITSGNVDLCSKGKMMSVRNVALGQGSATPEPTYAQAGASKPNVGLVGYYTDDKCASIDMYALKIGPTGWCKNTPCSGRQALVCADDYKTKISSVCGTKPYVQALQYGDEICGQLIGGALVPIDGLCHTADGRFFKATVNGDKTVTAGMYSDNKCSKNPQTSLITSDNVGQCIGGWAVNVVNQNLGKGPVTPASQPTTPPVMTYAVMSYYADDKCTTPPVVMAGPADMIPSGGCKNTTCTGRVTTQCTQNPAKAIATVTSGTKQYVMAQKYADAKCSEMSIIATTVVPVDGVCRAMPGQFIMAVLNADKTVSVGGYKDSTCKTTAGDLTLITSGKVGVCTDNTLLTVVGLTVGKGPATPTPTPKAAAAPAPPVATVRATFAVTSFFGDSKCASSPSMVMVSPTPKCSMTTCANQISTVCVDDYLKAVTTAMGSKPFVSVATFADDKCGILVSNTIMALDGVCRGAGGMFSKAVQNADLSIAVTYFSDAKCATTALSVVKVTKDSVNNCSSKTVASVANVKLTK